MIRLIAAEFKKVFKKKAIYIMLIVAIGFSVLTNVIYKYAVNNFFEEANRYTNKADRKDLIEYSKTLSLRNPNEVDEYISTQTEIYFYDFCLENEEWRCDVLTGDYYSTVYNYMDSIYNPKTSYDKEKTKAELDDIINLIKNNEIFKIYEIKKDQILKEIEELNKTKDMASKKELAQIEAEIISQKNEALKYELLIANKVTPTSDNRYLTNAIDSYIMSKTGNEVMDTHEKLDKEEKEEYKLNKERIALDKYIIDNKYDDTKATVSSNLKYFFGDFSFVIIIFVIIISGGIMADEYHKGTIKQLLIKPYTRSQILGSKLLTILLLIPIFAILVFILYFLITGIFTGFSGIFEAIPVYDYVKEEIITYNVFNYNALMFISKLPYFVIVSLISFTISTITSSTALSICMPLALVFFGNFINMAINSYQFKWLRWFITYVWEIEQYIFGRNYDNLLNSFKFNILFIVIYIVVIAILPFIFFNRKDIKNV